LLKKDDEKKEEKEEYDKVEFEPFCKKFKIYLMTDFFSGLPFSDLIHKAFKSVILKTDKSLKQDLNRFHNSEKKMTRDTDLKSIINVCRELRIIKDWYDYKHIYEDHKGQYNEEM